MYNYEFIIHDEKIVFDVIALLRSKLDVEPRHDGWSDNVKTVIHIMFKSKDKINLPKFLKENKIPFTSCYVMQEGKILDAYYNTQKEEEEIELVFIE